MHDRSTMDSLMRKIEALAREHGGRRITAVRVRLGALATMDPDHFREHFELASRGTPAEGATVEAATTQDLYGVFLLDVELET